MTAGDDDIGDFDPTMINAESRDLFFGSLFERPQAVDRRARADRGEFLPLQSGGRVGRQPKKLKPATDYGRGKTVGTGVGTNRGRSYRDARPTEQFNVRIDPDVKAAIQERSRLGNLPLGWLIEAIIRDYLDKSTVGDTLKWAAARGGE